jgi:hypothetical protein
MKLNDEIHDHCTRQNQIFMFNYAELPFFKNNVANVGIKLYNTLPNKVKL